MTLFPEMTDTGIPNVTLHEGFLTPSQSHALFQELRALPFEQRKVFVGGAWRDQPRLVCLLGEPGLSYRYSSMTLDSTPFPESLVELKRRVETFSYTTFNSCVVNYYRNGNDSIGMHRDNEPELGPDPIIASVSLGARRSFVMRPVLKGAPATIPLGDGSLLVMGKGVQRQWLHGIPKEPDAGARINLTFRQMTN